MSKLAIYTLIMPDGLTYRLIGASPDLMLKHHPGASNIRVAPDDSSTIPHASEYYEKVRKNRFP